MPRKYDIRVIAFRAAIFVLMRTAVVAVLSIAASVPASAAPRMKSDQRRIEGVWKFQKEVDATLNGENVVIPGPAYDGTLIYTSNGFVSVVLMPKGRTWDATSATAEQLRESVAEGSSTAYTGRYVVNHEVHTVTHLIVASVDPADEGRRLIRRYDFDGDKLLLSGPWMYHGKRLRFTVFWVRAK